MLHVINVPGTKAAHGRMAIGSCSAAVCFASDMDNTLTALISGGERAPGRPLKECAGGSNQLQPLPSLHAPRCSSQIGALTDRPMDPYHEEFASVNDLHCTFALAADVCASARNGQDWRGSVANMPCLRRFVSSSTAQVISPDTHVSLDRNVLYHLSRDNAHVLQGLSFRKESRCPQLRSASERRSLTKRSLSAAGCSQKRRCASLLLVLAGCSVFYCRMMALSCVTV